jgi:hypothetical protein
MKPKELHSSSHAFTCYCFQENVFQFMQISDKLTKTPNLWLQLFPEIKQNMLNEDAATRENGRESMEQ